jgi:predicted AlkP superfamily pyrophosphatase or phosphodiesterase
MTGAALGIEAAPGHGLAGSCGRGLTRPEAGGTHGFLPSRPGMATGFVAAGAGVRAGVTLDRIRLIDIAPTAARLLGLTPPPLEGRVLDEIVK